MRSRRVPGDAAEIYSPEVWHHCVAGTLPRPASTQSRQRKLCSADACQRSDGRKIELADQKANHLMAAMMISHAARFARINRFLRRLVRESSTVRRTSIRSPLSPSHDGSTTGTLDGNGCLLICPHTIIREWRHRFNSSLHDLATK